MTQACLAGKPRFGMTRRGWLGVVALGVSACDAPDGSAVTTNELKALVTLHAGQATEVDVFDAAEDADSWWDSEAGDWVPLI